MRKILVMTFNEWIEIVTKKGYLCDEYKNKVDQAMSKKQIMDIALDANGSEYLPKLRNVNLSLPYEIICNEFRSYINGKYIAEYKNGRGNGYTSSIYCCYNDNNALLVETTVITLLGCKCLIRVKENDYVKINADCNCELVIDCPTTSRCVVEYWGNAKIVVLGNYDNVELIDNYNEEIKL